MKENKKKLFDIEKYKHLDGTYHLEDEQLSENELKEFFNLLTSEDTIVVQDTGDTNLETRVDETTLNN